MNDIIATHDGSHSLFSNKYKASYHSHFGAIDEAITVFLSAGFDFKRSHIEASDTIKVLEMGFGSGLNAFLTAIQAQRLQQEVIYHSIESDPIPRGDWSKLNYGQILQEEDMFHELHDCAWAEDCSIHEYFNLMKINTKIQNHQYLEAYYDVIYYDAFAPSCQADLWTREIHQPIYNALATGGVFVTYCAQGKFKRLLKDLGYHLESLPGPAKKKEMTRALKF